MKIYIDLYDFEKNLISTPKNSYDLFHNYFYFCLLPKEFKKILLNHVDENAQKILHDILNVNWNFCDSFEECDYFIPYIPSIFTDIREYILHLSINSLYENKKILLFYGGDCDELQISNKNIIILRACGIKDTKNYNQIGIPTICRDFFDNKLIRKKLSLGFCGTLISSDFRKKIVNQLSNENYANFIIRNSWGNIDKLLNGPIMTEEKTPSPSSQFEYYKNIENNLYTLCVRGAGNFSFRLAETFMMGRIPVLIDTKCILPFQDKIPYCKNTIYVTEENSSNFTKINDIILEYHNSHSEDELLQIQYENRKIWLNYFKVDSAFYKTLNLLKKV
jgi:hypothetical protein